LASSRSADGSDSSREGELEYAFRRASDVLGEAIGGTLRQASDAAMVALSEVLPFDLLRDDEGGDWFAEAVESVLPALPGGAVVDAVLERLDMPSSAPVSKPSNTPPEETSAESSSNAQLSPAAGALAALVVARPAASGLGYERSQCHAAASRRPARRAIFN
jgi:hypothetical protein